MKEDLFIYRIIEKSWYNRHFRQRHEVRFERNIQLVLHEFALMKEVIHYVEEEILNRSDSATKENPYWKRIIRYTKICRFIDDAWNIICQKELKENDFK